MRAQGTDPPASDSQYNGLRVLAVRFEPTAQPLSADALARIMPLKPGAPFQAAQLTAAIKRLFGTGRYEDIVAEGEPESGGIVVVLHTREQWFVGRVAGGGKLKAPPNEGQIANVTGLELGQPVSQDEIGQATQNVASLLRRNGFYEAKVEPKVTRDSAHQQMNLEFDVDPGKRARIAEPAVTGDPKMETEDVVDATKWHHWFHWRQATEQNVESGVQNVRKNYARKNRLAAQIGLRGMQYDSKSNHVTPTLHVMGGPKVKLETAGAKVSTRKLKNYVPVFDEETVYRDLLVEGAHNLRDYFQMQGYFDVKVDFRTQQPDSDHEEIVYVIDLGRRRRVARVRVAGSRYFSADVIRQRLFVQPAGVIRYRHGRYSEGFISRDKSGLKDLYEANGFRDVQVTARTSNNYRGRPGDIAVVYTITEGPQYVVAAVQVDGVRQINRGEIVSGLSSAPGEPFSEVNTSLDRTYIVRLYNSQGFPATRVEWSYGPGPEPRQVNVQYHVVEGEKHYVRDVLISGLKITNPHLLNRVVTLKPGDPLALTQLTRIQQNLYELGIFDQVDTAVQNPQGDTQSKYALYQIDEGHRYRLAGGIGAEVAQIGGGQNSLSNPQGTTGFSPRANLEIDRLNLWGLGHTVDLKTQLSTLEQRVEADYLAPRYRNVDGRNLSFTALYDALSNVRTFKGKRLEGDAQISQKLSKATTMLYRFSYSRVSVDTSTLKIQPLLIPLLSQPARIGMLSSSISQDRRDNPTDSHGGIYNTLDFGVADTAFGSQKDFGRLLATNATYHSFGPAKSLVLARRIQFGWIAPWALHGTDRSQAIPLVERFFSGGSTSLRGFPDNQAGPRDQLTGFPLGGNALFIHNTELRFPLLGDNIDGVLFHDMGNVYSTVGDISFRVHQRSLTDFNYMVHAVGFGIRYKTPVGPVRVDLAYSLNPPSFYGLKGTPQQLLFLSQNPPRVLQNVGHFQFFFSIGQAF